MRPASARKTVPRRAHGQQVCAKAIAMPGRAHPVTAQMLSLRAFTGYAFTIFRAGLAFTITTLPKTSRLPAFVAGFVRVLILHRPGTVKIPVLDTSWEAISAKLPMTFMHTDFFNSHSLARASAMAPLPIAFWVCFMGAILTGELIELEEYTVRRRRYKASVAT